MAETVNLAKMRQWDFFARFFFKCAIEHKVFARVVFYECKKVRERKVHNNIQAIFRACVKGRLHELIKGPFSAPISGPYLVSRSVLALKTGPF